MEIKQRRQLFQEFKALVLTGKEKRNLEWTRYSVSENSSRRACLIGMAAFGAGWSGKGDTDKCVRLVTKHLAEHSANLPLRPYTDIPFILDYLVQLNDVAENFDQLLKESEEAFIHHYIWDEE